ncbi:hypothetical protein, partial [Xanthomonas euvesicatoria]|uniref:hypothetical protein n=1 Tax=Xanthomonas euvesicatoria TaxID=456327 RepID=UPI00062DBEDA
GFALALALGFDAIFFELDRRGNFVTDDRAEIFLADPAEPAEAVRSLLPSDDVGVSPSDNDVGRFVESKDAVNESLSTAEDTEMAVKRRRNGVGERIGMDAGKS